MILSHGLRQVLEGLPARVPLSIEVLDRSFAVIVPEAAYRPFPLLELTKDLREQLSSASSGRPRTVVQKGQRIDLYPVVAPGDRTWTLLLAVGADEADPSVLAAWGPILRSALEADLTTLGDVQRQAHAARHLGAVLRFVRYLAEINSETEMLRAVLQSAAVWFDLDTRIYRRDASGDFVPHMYLPSVVVSPQHRIPGAMIDGVGDTLRLSSGADLDSLGLPGDSAILIPLTAPRTDLLLVLSGTLPPDVELTFGTVARVAGQVLEGGKRRAAAAVRKPLIAAFEPGAPFDKSVARALRIIVEETRATAGMISAHAGELRRPLASIGEPPAAAPPPADGEVRVTPWADRMSVALAAGADTFLVVDLACEGDRRFDMTARHALEEAAELLSVWLSGHGTREVIRQFLMGIRRDRAAAFLARVEEEIARAKRFHLDLAIVVVRSDAMSRADRFEQLVGKVKAELRDSDLLAPLSQVEVAALLIQTGGGGGEAVVRRLHRRLAEDDVWRGAAIVGHAAFSQECPTAAALLSRARGPADDDRRSPLDGDIVTGDEEFFARHE